MSKDVCRGGRCDGRTRHEEPKEIGDIRKRHGGIRDPENVAGLGTVQQVDGEARKCNGPRGRLDEELGGAIPRRIKVQDGSGINGERRGFVQDVGGKV